MCAQTTLVGLRPPLVRAWTSTIDLANALPGTADIYGITQDGKIAALRSDTGAVRWQTTKNYLRNRLTVVGSTIYAYRKDDGLAVISDHGTSFTESLIVSINPLTESEPVSNLVVDGANIFMVINQALIVLKQNGDLIGGTGVGSQTPYMLGLVGSNRCVAVDGYGQPQMFELSGGTVKRLWYTTLEEPGAVRSERPVVVASGLIIAGSNDRLVAYELNSGALEWDLPQVSAERLLVDGGTVYAVGKSGQLHAIDAASGRILWRRMYLAGAAATLQTGLALANGYLYVTAWVGNGGPLHLFAVSARDGQFAWQSNLASAGLPLRIGDRLLVYGTSAAASAMVAAENDKISNAMISWQPTPLRGARSGFKGSLTLDLPVSATVTISLLREGEGLGDRLLDRSAKAAGRHVLPWDAGTTGGFSDQNQFGRIMVDVEHAGASPYTLAKLLPVNTLPDLLGHWAKNNIEIMIFKQYIGGYPDLTFRPDNMVTRAECSAIIAKTLALEAPSAGFRTRFTDIAGHWARNQIMALEEKEIIGGFLEDDGTYTYRPELNMTRAQEARILVKAYQVPPAPQGFVTKFTDTGGHWARPDIEALEAAGHVNGFAESNGTFTYRPEQSLTRAELCTVVVRIRQLTRT